MLSLLKFQQSQSLQSRVRGCFLLLLMSVHFHLGACNSPQNSTMEESADRTVTIMGVIVGEEQEKLEKALAFF